MARDGSITPSDLVDKLDWLVVSRENCGRHGRYKVARLVGQLGADAKLTDWLAEITGGTVHAGNRSTRATNYLSEGFVGRFWPIA